MRSDPCAVSPAYNIRPELIEYTARVYTRYTEPAFCELTNTGPRLVYRGKLKIHRKSRVGRPTLFPRNLVLSCDSWHPQFLPRIRLGGTKKRKEKKDFMETYPIWICYLNKRVENSFPFRDSSFSNSLFLEISQSFVSRIFFSNGLISVVRHVASTRLPEHFRSPRAHEPSGEIVTFAPSCAPTRRCMEQPETRADLLSPWRLYELAEVSSPRSSRYSNMLFYGAIIGTVIIIKSEAVCSRVSPLSKTNELVVSLRLIRSSRSRVLLHEIFNAIEYSTNSKTNYIRIRFFSPGKKESSFGKKKKIIVRKIMDNVFDRF